MRKLRDREVSNLPKVTQTKNGSAKIQILDGLTPVPTVLSSYITLFLPSLLESEEKKILCKTVLTDFPGGAVVKNPPANAGGHGFEPWSWKIPHAAKQLNPCTTTTELAL